MQVIHDVTNEDGIINLLIDKIKLLPNKTEFTILQLIDVDMNKVLAVSIDTFKKLEEQGIKVKQKFDKDAIIRLSQSMIYIKDSDDKLLRKEKNKIKKFGVK